MKNLAVIVPYKEKEKYHNLDNDCDKFLSHFRETINEDNFNYTIIFIKQKSNRPLNKGKLFNIGYLLNKDKYDYFCFHDIEFIPLNAECDYSYSNTPISLLSMVLPVKFGEHDSVDEKLFSKFTLPYQKFFGGATLFNKDSFEKINGFSNLYWGSGYDDYDLLSRCIMREIELEIIHSKIEMKTVASFNGENSYIEISGDLHKIKNSTVGDFTFTSFININKLPPTSIESDTNKCQYVIFGKPGYHSGLSYRNDGYLQATLWILSSKTGQKELIMVEYPMDYGTWNHIAMVNTVRKNINNYISSLKLYINGRLVSEVDYEGSAVSYHNKPLYIGVGDPTISQWKNYFDGMITDVGIWDTDLSNSSIKELYIEGDKNIETAIGFWNFEGGYNNQVFDSTGNLNNGTMYNISFSSKKIKNSTIEYLPIRRNGGYGYIGSDYKFKSLSKLDINKDPEIIKNKDTFNKKINNSMSDIDKDGLPSTKFRIVKKGNYSQIIYGSNPDDTKDELIEVII